MILNANEGIKFLFLFYFHIVFLLPAFFLSCFPLPCPPSTVVVCFLPRQITRRRRENVFRVAVVGGWFFCALAEKYGFGEILIFPVVSGGPYVN